MTYLLIAHPYLSFFLQSGYSGAVVCSRKAYRVLRDAQIEATPPVSAWSVEALLPVAGEACALSIVA